MRVRCETYIFFWILNRLLDFLDQRFQDSQLISLRWQSGVFFAVEQICPEPCLDIGISQQLFGRPDKEFRLK